MNPTGAREQPRRRTGLMVMTAALPLAFTGLGVTFYRPADAAVDPVGARSRAVTAAAASADRTSPAEARRVDRVPTPVLHWTTCQKTFECASVGLPLDYDHPHGPTIKLALLRFRAKDAGRRLGTLFVNPGGPGAPARDAVVQFYSQLLPESVLDRFDIVGVDPRGVGGSRPLRCFSTKAEQTRIEGPLDPVSFPVTPAEQRSAVAAAKGLGRACSTTARSIASAMSTTEDARDMDVLRRAVGDSKLTYFGGSGGSFLGQVYANLFPDRVRALALDGMIDPRTYVGTPATADVPFFVRSGAAAASYGALHELLERCQQAGPSQCSFAGADTQARFDHLAVRLQARPLRLAAHGTPATTYTYASLVEDTEEWLHDPEGYKGLFADLTDLMRLTAPDGGGSDHDAIVVRLLARHPAPPPVPGYDNTLEAISGIECSDGLHAADAASWPAATAAADTRSPYFGSYYGWLSAQCATNTWTAQDEDAYRGPFNRRTAAPVLVVGARWDPATNFDNAVKVAHLLPDSRLVASDNWGHTSWTTSACVDNAIYGYLIDPLAPAPTTTYCRGDVQPFTRSPSTHRTGHPRTVS
jgi:pimeloyl-ACP methyl ester carboxylesterase